MIESYKELIVWQRSIELTVEIYNLTRQFPKTEQFGLVAQMRRSSVSIASNIAEGKCRKTRKDFCNFLHIAYGSGAELETQIHLAKLLDETKNLQYRKTEDLLCEVMKMLNVMMQKLKANP